MLIVHQRKEPSAQIAAGRPEMLLGERAHHRVLDEVIGTVGFADERLGWSARQGSEDRAAQAPAAGAPIIGPARFVLEECGAALSCLKQPQANHCLVVTPAEALTWFGCGTQALVIPMLLRPGHTQ